MRIPCLIVDDEPIAQNILKSYIADVATLKLVGVASNALEAFEFLQTKEVSILFLDIEMPKISGLNFLKSLQKPPTTILTTAYRDFALEGYDLGVVDYLLKPFSLERFLKAVDKAVLFQKNKNKENTPSPEHKKFIYFRVDRKNVRVFFTAILYIEGLSNYVKIYTEEETLIVYHKLSELEKILPHDQFLRIHKSYLVALEKIEAYGKGFVEIQGKVLPIGHTYKKTVLGFFKA